MSHYAQMESFAMLSLSLPVPVFSFTCLQKQYKQIITGHFLFQCHLFALSLHCKSSTAAAWGMSQSFEVKCRSLGWQKQNWTAMQQRRCSTDVVFFQVTEFGSILFMELQVFLVRQMTRHVRSIICREQFCCPVDLDSRSEVVFFSPRSSVKQWPGQSQSRQFLIGLSVCLLYSDSIYSEVWADRSIYSK